MVVDVRRDQPAAAASSDCHARALPGGNGLMIDEPPPVAPGSAIRHVHAMPHPELATSLSDRYRIERQLGAGGMATVYLAHDLKHERDVAIKVLHSELSESLGSERFLREIRLAAALTHPHILPLFDSGDAGGQM